MRAIAGLLLLLFSSLAQPAQVSFVWDTPIDKTGVVGYFLGCGPVVGNNGTPTKAPGANTTTLTLTLAPGNWFCAAWSYGAPDTLVSAKSNEVPVVVPLGAPSNLRFTVTLTWDEERGIYVAKAGPVREIP